MLFIDTKYITTVGFYLRNFKKKKDNLYNCSCPLCGDSEKKKAKARGYFYQKNSSMFYKCHNCGAGLSIGNFLKECFPAQYDQYVLEKYKSNTEIKKDTIEKLDVVKKIQLCEFKTSYAKKLSELDDNHYAKKYAISRKIPRSVFNRIFFTEDFSELVDDVFPNMYENLQKNDPRLVIPFFSSDKKIIGMQGRSFGADKKLRYITIRANKDIDLIYGLDCFDRNKTGYVVEGPIDSLFIPNCISPANSDLVSVSHKLNLQNLVLIYDNEPRNREIVNLIKSAIDNGNNVCIWPKDVREKDINDMILNGKTKEEILSIIHNRTFSGLKAQLEFSQWKKC
jgi:hypothetical protein